MQRRWVPISLWPNMGNGRFSSSAVTNAATEPNSSDRIYRDTGSVLTKRKLVSRCFKWQTVWLSNQVLTFREKFLCLHCSSLSPGVLLHLNPPDTRRHHTHAIRTMNKKNNMYRKSAETQSCSHKCNYSLDEGQSLAKSWLISAGRFRPHQDKSDARVSRVLWWWGGWGRVQLGCFLSFTAPSWHRRTPLWGSTWATQRWRTASCSQEWTLSSPHTWWSRPGGSHRTVSLHFITYVAWCHPQIVKCQRKTNELNILTHWWINY